MGKVFDLYPVFVVGSNNLAAEAADLVLLQENSLSKVPELLKTTRNILRVARSTAHYGMMASCAQMSLAAVGILNPFLSASLQELVDLSTILYALSVHAQRL